MARKDCSFGVIKNSVNQNSSEVSENETCNGKLNIKYFKKGQGWSFETVKMKAGRHGYDREANQNPFGKDDPRFDQYEYYYNGGLNQR